ncbi:Protein of unknown function, partial [Gryllus bimaculatus]
VSATNRKNVVEHSQKIMDEYREKDGVDCENNKFIIHLKRDMKISRKNASMIMEIIKVRKIKVKKYSDINF